MHVGVILHYLQIAIVRLFNVAIIFVLVIDVVGILETKGM